MKKFLDLGMFHLHKIDNNSHNNSINSEYPLMLVHDDALNAIRLSEFLPANLLYGEYWYSSGSNELMVEALKEVIKSVLNNFIKSIHENGVWIDIASNDGTLLANVPSYFNKIGIDPIKGVQLNKSKQIADILNDYFTIENYMNSKYKDLTADVITCIAMFYDIPDPIKFLNDVSKILNEDGVFVLQMSYTPLMISQLAFDNICHEHLYYYDLTAIKRLAELSGFTIVDVSLNDANGGSFRIYFKKTNHKTWTHLTEFQRLVNETRIDSLISYENFTLNIRSINTWISFQDNINEVKEKILHFIEVVINEGKTIMAYGASTKGSTLMQYFGLDKTKIDAIVERDERKVGLYLSGSGIPIISESEMRLKNPDYLLILPWHFLKSFMEREHEYLKNGGKFIVPLPRLSIVSLTSTKEI